jgi:hypothetical protein
MVKKPIFTFYDAWPWALLLAFIGGAVTKAILYAQTNGYDRQGFTVLAITCAVFLFLTLLRYTLRAVGIEAWNSAFQTRLGTAVIPGKVEGVPYRGIDTVCDNAAFYWADWAVKNKGMTSSCAKTLVANGFYGATISVSDHVIQYGNQSWSGKLLGVQDGQHIGVVYDGNVVIDDAQFLQLVRHEVSHLCLTALGVAPGAFGTFHHAIFAETGYC